MDHIKAALTPLIEQYVALDSQIDIEELRNKDAYNQLVYQQVDVDTAMTDIVLPYVGNDVDRLAAVIQLLPPSVLRTELIVRLNRLNSLAWYLSYYPMEGTNRKFVLFYRNNMGWPERCFADEENHIRAFAQDKAKTGTELLMCNLVGGVSLMELR